MTIDSTASSRGDKQWAGCRCSPCCRCSRWRDEQRRTRFHGSTPRSSERASPRRFVCL